MKILTIALVLGLSLPVYGGLPVGVNSIENDSLPPIKAVERLDTTIAAPAVEAWGIKQQVALSSVRVSGIINQLENGELSQEEAQETIDSLISSIYLASTSFFENYKATTTESVVDSFSRDDELYDLSDFDSQFEGEKKTFVFEWHIGSNRLLKNNFSDASAMEHVNDWLSVENRLLFSQKRRLGGHASLFQLQTGLGFSSTVFSFNNERTISKDILGGTGTGLFPIFNMNTVWSSNWRYTHLNAPIMLHLDLSPKGTFNDGLNLGVGLEGRMRIRSSAAYRGHDMDNDDYKRRVQSGFNTHLFNYAILAQCGYNQIKATLRLEQKHFFKDGTFEQDVILGSLCLGYSW
jgi:polyhydroxyalkanoate synthesis regulator phasin